MHSGEFGFMIATRTVRRVVSDCYLMENALASGWYLGEGLSCLWYALLVASGLLSCKINFLFFVWDKVETAVHHKKHRSTAPGAE